MLKRRSHNKSRRGCQSCKKRHIKCDETRPQCDNCTVRGIACVYQLPLATKSQFVLQTPRRKVSSEETKSNGSKESSSKPVESRMPSPKSSSTPSTSVATFSSTGESDRLLELELMHRWSTKTWTALYSVPEDQESLQITLPRVALSDSYLLNIILAISASDLANQYGDENCSTAAVYRRAAAQYGQKAGDDYRLQLSRFIPQEKVPFLYHFAVIGAIFNFSVPSGPPSAFARLNALFDMIVGAYVLLVSTAPWLPNCFKRVMEEFDPTAMDLVDGPTQAILDKLTSVSCQFRVPGMKAHAGPPNPLACDVETYRIAIAHTKHCFAEDSRGRVRGSCFSIVTAVDQSFFQAVKVMEPMALFILLLYGVLLDRAAQDKAMWWLASGGKAIVEEISGILALTPIVEIPDAVEVIAWTKQEVGLSTPGQLAKYAVIS